MSSGPENKFRKQLVLQLKSMFGDNIYIQKNHGSAFSAGLVDMEVVLFGKVGFYELKAGAGPYDPKAVTALQRTTLQAIERAGGQAYVLHYNTDLRTVACYKAEHAFGVVPMPRSHILAVDVAVDRHLMRQLLDLARCAWSG